MSTAVVTPIRQAAPDQTGHIRLTRRGRLVFTTLAAAPLIAVAAWLGVNALPAVATSDSSAVVFEYATIEAGQSLWELASTVAPEADPRDVIADLMRLNQLDSSTVSPGQRIAIPEQYSRS
jgi:hypothetical protein